MATSLTKLTLSEPRQKLIELMAEISFGKICGLVMLRGEPQLSPELQIIHDVKLDCNGEPTPPRASGDFALKQQVCELFRQFDRFGDGTVESIEIRHGLPFRLLIRGCFKEVL